MVDKPDVYICLNCDHRFQKPKLRNFKDEEEEIFVQRPACPNCGSDEITTSAIELKRDQD